MVGESVVAALREIWKALEPLDVPMALMGGMAVSAWGHIRTTRDVDVLIGVEPAASCFVSTGKISPNSFTFHAMKIGRFKSFFSW